MKEALVVKGVLDTAGVHLEIDPRPLLPGDSKKLGVLHCRGGRAASRIEFFGLMEGGEPGAEERAREAILAALGEDLETRAGKVQEMRSAFDRAMGREDPHSLEFFDRQRQQAQA